MGNGVELDREDKMERRLVVLSLEAEALSLDLELAGVIQCLVALPAF
jgi:hypothetical protein